MQKEALSVRFDHLADTFVYDADGSIGELNRNFTWNKYSALEVANYILDLLRTSEYTNISSLTDVRVLKASIRKAAWF